MNMKKVFAIALALVMLLGAVACAAPAANTDTPAANTGATAFVTADGKCACGKCTVDMTKYSPYIQELIYNAHVNNETLTVYGACDESYVKAAAAKFQELFQITTNATRYATGEMFTKTDEEKNNPQADVWFGGSNDYYFKAKDAGLLQAYKPENAKNLIDNPAFIDKDYEWVGIYTGVLGIMFNTEEGAALGLEAPKSWEDLRDPKWQGLIAVPNPETSATATNFLATQKYRYGYPGSLDSEGLAAYLKDFDKNVVMYTKSGSGPSKMVGPGECVVGISFLHDGVAQIANGYDNIQLIVPEDGTGFEVGAAAMLKNDKNPNAAKLFVEFCLTADCVNLGKDYQSMQNLVITDKAGAVQPELLKQFGLDDLSKLKLVPYDVADVAPQLNTWTQEWLQIVGTDDRHEKKS
jgi:iron(III) transport system substrate-binding protein